MRPISRKIVKANSISAKNLHERLNVYNPDDELGELAIAFNGLLDRLDSSFSMQKLFVANASHEIKNPLTAILGEAEVTLEKERSSSDYQEALRNISHEADRLNMLVNNLLQLSSVSYGSTEIKREDIPLIKLLEDALKKFDSFNPDHRVIFKGGHSPRHAKLIVRGNAGLLENALINIFDNASKFSSNQTVDVSIDVHADTVSVVVKDYGVGIPAEDMHKITQPFFRANNVRQIRGTGIGIPLTLKIVELHLGELKVTSTLHEGTEVRITLPSKF
jgi:signal transduction histidine kinase